MQTTAEPMSAPKKKERPVVRNVRFDLGRVKRRAWHAHGQAVTNFFDNLSVFFPLGERFFVESVRKNRRAVEDPKLEREVRDFCGQEGMHGREHDGYNKMLAERGYPVEKMEKNVAFLLKLARRLPRRFQLAITCGLEHCTALMAHALLGDESNLEGADPVMAALWRWHAAEENEHKAVCFDVYLAAGGKDAERIAAMVLASTIFWFKVAEHQIRFMGKDGIALSGSEWLAFVRFLASWVPGVAGLYAQYFRPGFHPNDIDASHLLEAWKLRDDLQATAATAG